MQGYVSKLSRFFANIVKGEQKFLVVIYCDLKYYTTFIENK